jgi:glucose-1-phosphate adenylyltransferase
VLILAGDHVYKQDYGILIAEHVARAADVTVSCVSVPRDEARRFGIVTVNSEEQIASFIEKPAAPNPQPDDPNRCLASMGIYLFNTDVFLAALRADAKNPKSKRDFGGDIIPGLVGKCRMYAHQFGRSCVSTHRADEPYWRDVGTIDSFWQANMDLVAAQPAFDLYDRNWPVWTYQEQRPPAKLVFDPAERLGMVSATMIAEGCVVAGATVRRSQLFTDVRLEPSSLVEDSVVLPGCEVKARVRISRAILAPGCVVPEGCIIGEDLDDDRARFQVTPAGVTVVTPRMLERLRQAPDRDIRVARAAQRALADERVRAAV